VKPLLQVIVDAAIAAARHVVNGSFVMAMLFEKSNDAVRSEQRGSSRVYFVVSTSTDVKMRQARPY
jgi:hypothetical protein